MLTIDNRPPPSRAKLPGLGKGVPAPRPAGWDSVRGLEPGYAFRRPGGRALRRRRNTCGSGAVTLPGGPQTIGRVVLQVFHGSATSA